MTSAERLATALGHREPDRVPFLLPANLHAAKEVGVPLATYFGRAEYVAEGQWRVREKYGHDALLGFLYAALDAAAWGADVIFQECGPPVAGAPPLRPADIERREPPRVAEQPCLRLALEVIERLVERAAGEVPVMGVVVSPFSLPAMQVGIETWLVMLYEQPERVARLLALNEAFCRDWANAQLAAGATAISMADPLASPAMVPAEMYRSVAGPSARRTLAGIHGPVATSFASTSCLPIIDQVAETGTIAVSASALEDLGQVKAACRGRLTVMGNLNAIEMRRWTTHDAEREVRAALAQAAAGGGFVLTDNHGEIPWQVPDEVLLAVRAAVEEWGRYPLDWVAEDGR